MWPFCPSGYRAEGLCLYAILKSMPKEKANKNSNIALYRKYRPQNFKEVLGQEQVTRVLQGALARGAINHAYLFSGARGTGKTSIARIFAQEIGVSGNDLYEIDAASNRGIDDIRALREAVNTLPFESPYKVYIVDECHMLTKEAFNALLKTLEEPPKHVIFILATTEIDRLPGTIISRCETHLFKKPSHALLKDLVLSVAKKEGGALPPASAELIAMLGDGSFRDTLGVLQKVISVSAGAKIDTDEVEQIVGAPRRQLVNDILKAVAEKNLDEGLKAVRQAVEHDTDMKVFLKLILQKIRFVLLLRFSSDSAYIKDALPEADFALLSDLAKNKDANISSATLLTLLDSYDQISRAYIPQLPLELALIKIIPHNNSDSTV